MKIWQNLSLLWHIGHQMGWYYVLFRVGYWLQAKTGVLKLRFPRKATTRSFTTIEQWRNHKPAFLFDPEKLVLQRNEGITDLKWRAGQIKAQRFRYFGKQWFEVSDWHTNPLTGFVYPKYQHWSEIVDFSPEAGDIKYVWEKSRFTFLYDLIRYDFHFSEDQSEIVVELITDWIDNNPANCGPNWKCSQEIALRVLNWTFALHYYRFSPALNQLLLDKILCSIYDQMRHVAGNIQFSAMAVRNNHVLTEALGLYVAGLMFPYFPESKQWRANGKSLFEREIITQIAPDGTYLQFSMNYHRVVVQLMTWGICLSEMNSDPFCETIYVRAKASLTFLQACQNDVNGQLPNYGHNDGALFFPLSECGFRDFRPQMGALANVLGVDLGYQTGHWREESDWLAGSRSLFRDFVTMQPETVVSFPTGGYYLIRDLGTLTFLRCGSYYSRPFQADNNHLDIWVGARNILRDAGTWLYNADEESARYFFGTRSHNTIILDDFDQMQKRHRFIWTHWITRAMGKSGSSDRKFWIEGEFEGFRHLGKGIVHKRKVFKKSGQLHWLIEDRVLNVSKGMQIRQLWHPDATFLDSYRITASDENGSALPMVVEKGWYSDTYGMKVESEIMIFETYGNFVRTTIKRI